MITRNDYPAGTGLHDTDTGRTVWLSAAHAPPPDATQDELREAMEPARIKGVEPYADQMRCRRRPWIRTW